MSKAFGFVNHKPDKPDGYPWNPKYYASLYDFVSSLSRQELQLEQNDPGYLDHWQYQKWGNDDWGEERKKNPDFLRILCSSIVPVVKEMERSNRNGFCGGKYPKNWDLFEKWIELIGLYLGVEYSGKQTF